MRKVVGVFVAVVFAVVVSAGPAGARVEPPHCDPGACIDPVEVAERAVCYVGTQLGFHCV